MLSASSKVLVVDDRALALESRNWSEKARARNHPMCLLPAARIVLLDQGVTVLVSLRVQRHQRCAEGKSVDSFVRPIAHEHLEVRRTAKDVAAIESHLNDDVGKAPSVRGGVCKEDSTAGRTGLDGAFSLVGRSETGERVIPSIGHGDVRVTHKSALCFDGRGGIDSHRRILAFTSDIAGTSPAEIYFARTAQRGVRIVTRSFSSRTISEDASAKSPASV